jgi:serine phosphatase RsbU (regulator of sigma subunit)
MTMMVSTQLNYLIDSNPGILPDQVLTELHALVQNTLRSEKETAHLENGLDIGLVFLPKGSQELIFAGAGLPIYFTQPEGQVEYIPGDRVHLGFSSGHKLNLTMIQNQHITIEPGRCFYLLTDGILDLPGGDRGFGLGKSGLIHVLSQAALVSLEERETKIHQRLMDFQGQHQRKDDQLLIGFEIPEESSI